MRRGRARKQGDRQGLKDTPDSRESENTRLQIAPQLVRKPVV